MGAFLSNILRTASPKLQHANQQREIKSNTERRLTNFITSSPFLSQRATGPNCHRKRKSPRKSSKTFLRKSTFQPRLAHPSGLDSDCLYNIVCQVIISMTVTVHIFLLHLSITLFSSKLPFNF